MSCILRVSATCTLGDDLEQTKEVSFVIKRMPVLQVQQAMTRELKLFDHEVNFFNKCLPLLRRKCPDLKFVDCLFAHSASTIVMEDLNQKGFRTVHSNFEDVKTQVLVTIYLKFSRTKM
jgi:Ecdysteroid kinase-like family